MKIQANWRSLKVFLEALQNLMMKTFGKIKLDGLYWGCNLWLLFVVSSRTKCYVTSYLMFLQELNVVTVCFFLYLLLHQELNVVTGCVLIDVLSETQCYRCFFFKIFDVPSRTKCCEWLLLVFYSVFQKLNVINVCFF